MANALHKPRYLPICQAETLSCKARLEIPSYNRLNNLQPI